MQEKVQPKVPTIKIFEEKPAATSWVKENIVKYYQVQSRAVFLKDVLAYVRQLQAEQLRKARPPAVAPIEEAYVAVPEKGSATDISNATVFNAVQKHVKTEIEFLEKLILLLKAGSPELADELDKALTQLRQTAQAFPDLSSEQLDALSQLMERLVNLSEHAPFPTKRLFWNVQLRMIRQMMTHNRTSMNETQKELTELQGRTKVLTELEEIIQHIRQALTSTPLNQDKFQSLMKNLEHLANQYGQLNPQQQQAMMSYFQNLTQLKSGSGQNLAQLAADTLIETKIAEFLKKNPGATTAEIVQYLHTFLSGSNLKNSSLSFMKELGDEMENLLKRPGFPRCSGFSGVAFATGEEKKIEPNESFADLVLANFVAPAPQSMSQVEGATEKLTGALSDELENKQITEMGHQSSVNTLKTTQKNLGRSALWSVSKSLGVGQPPPAAAGTTESPDQTLPGQFADAILNHFLPQEEAYLMELAAFMYLNNMGAHFGNVLLDEMKDFQQASTYYNLNHTLQPASDSPNPPTPKPSPSDDDPRYNGTAADAQKDINQEINQANVDLQAIQKALNDVADQLQQVQQQIDNTPPEDPKYQTLIQMRQGLMGIKNNLIISQGQLNDLLKTLKVLQPVDVKDSKPPEFSMQSPSDPDRNWIKNLPDQEGFVINGDPSLSPDPKHPGPIGGLSKVQAQADEFQGVYSSQSEQQMMTLQMHMTTQQQYWTVITTGLTLLNQMYMILAQAVNK